MLVPCWYKNNPLSRAILRGFCLFIMVKLHDSVDRYFICLSSHLQMKWQITPAVIDTQSDVNMSMLIPLSVARLGATTRQLYHTKTFTTIILNYLCANDNALNYKTLIQRS